ncbi:hypothetical protein LJC13_03745 [Peptostreptococcaceae bacterium OttesenSCG-928-C18]|nr:hypothetical protein [Peptostreptococcaceae bacterium OttesenSCG-928-C18]
MKKLKVVALLTIGALIFPNVAKANTLESEINNKIVEETNQVITPFSLAVASVTISRTGSTFTGNVRISSGNVTSSNLVLQRKVNGSWSDYRILSSSTSKVYSKSTSVSVKGTFRFKLRCNIGSTVENHYSGAITY